VSARTAADVVAAYLPDDVPDDVRIAMAALKALIRADVLVEEIPAWHLVKLHRAARYQMGVLKYVKEGWS